MDRRFNSVLVTGGAGYCGSLIVPQLLEAGYDVIVYDVMFYGQNHLPKDHPNLKIVEGDIRDTVRLGTYFKEVEGVLHLACVSNDASFELDEALSTTINLDAFQPMVIAAKGNGIKRFVYVSSSSVYGVSDAPDVTEDHPLVPLTLYNKYKGMCEPLLLEQTNDDFVGVVLRPATVCGYAPRQRLDLTVNILTNHAVNNKVITVFGGDQLRPNLHVQDYADVCSLLLAAPDEQVADEIFNCGYQNMSVMEIAEVVKNVVEQEFPELGDIAIKTTPTDDNRSYHINSDKIFRQLNYKPQFSVDGAVRDLCNAFKEGKLPNSCEDDRYHNVRTMKLIEAA
jgi:nucleoside-diphosphate-sugar epimerase